MKTLEEFKIETIKEDSKIIGGTASNVSIIEETGGLRSIVEENAEGF